MIAYIALFFALLRRLTALTWGSTWVTSFIAHFFNIHRSDVLTALAWLVPHETAAVSVQILCTPYNHAPCHFMQSHIHNGVCVFGCNLAPALLAEWPGSFTCYCGNTGVERISWLKRTARPEAEWPLNGPKGTTGRKKWRKKHTKKPTAWSVGFKIPTNSANQNVTIHILHEKPEELHLCFPHKARHINEATDHWILSKTFKISNSTHSLLSRDISCNQMRQPAVTWTLNDSNHGQLHQSTQYHMTVGSQA